MTKKYPTCGECPAEFKEDCPFYEPDTDDNPCIYEFFRARREREEKEKNKKKIFKKLLTIQKKVCYNYYRKKGKGK